MKLRWLVLLPLMALASCHDERTEATAGETARLVAAWRSNAAIAPHLPPPVGTPTDSVEWCYAQNPYATWETIGPMESPRPY